MVPSTLTLEPSSQEGVAFYSSAPTQAFRPPDQPRWVAQRRRLRLRSPDSAQRMATVSHPRPGVPAGACAQEAAGTIWGAHRLGGPRRSLASMRGVTETVDGCAAFQVLVLSYRHSAEDVLYAFSDAPTPPIGKLSPVVESRTSRRCRRPGAKPPRRRACPGIAGSSRSTRVPRSRSSMSPASSRGARMSW